MGSASTKPTESAVLPSSDTENVGGAVGSSRGASCPVKHDTQQQPPPRAISSKCPVQHSPSQESSSGCPVKHSNKQQQQQYNVYSQPIDPTNQMPAVANQLPSPQQTQPLSTERIKSTIPKVRIHLWMIGLLCLEIYSV